MTDSDWELSSLREELAPFHFRHGSSHSNFRSNNASHRSYSTFPSLPRHPGELRQRKTSVLETWWGTLSEHPLWKLTSVVVCLVVYHHSQQRSSNPQGDLFLPLSQNNYSSSGSQSENLSKWSWDHYIYNTDSQSERSLPEWSWDHYHYNEPQVWRTNTAEDATIIDNLLIAQLAPSLAPAAARIVSRPNRAYARKWGMDYVLYAYSSSTSPLVGQRQSNMQCAQRHLLQTVLTKQATATAKVSSSSSTTTHPDTPVARKYDAVLLLPPNTLLTDLDFDLRSLLPPDKLLARIIRRNEEDEEEDEEEDLMFWNLGHDQSTSILSEWKKTTPPSSLLSPVACPIPIVDDELMESLPVEDGFVPPRLIRLADANVVVRNSDYENLGDLQNQADAVCYRFYPRCEVL